LSQVHMQFAGVAAVSTDADGNLVLHTAGGSTLVEHAPSLYQEAGDRSHTLVAGRFSINDDGTVGFVAGAYDAAPPLIVDPTPAYSSYFGGTAAETAIAVAADPSGNSYQLGQIPAFGGGAPIQTYVAAFSPDGSTLRYVSYFGSAYSWGTVQGTGIAVDP